jgi:hypothetical protein
MAAAGSTENGMPKGIQRSNREKKKPKQEKNKKSAAAPSQVTGIKVQGQTIPTPGAKKER